LLLARGEALRLGGDTAFRETLLEAARSALARGDGELAARAVLANRRALMGWMSQPDPERVALLEAAIDAQAGTDDVTLARLLALLGFELVAGGHWSRRVALSDRALAMARRSGDRAALAEVLDLRSETLAHPSTLEERMALADEQVELTEGLRDPAPRARALLHGVVAGFEAGRLDLVDARLDRAERLADEHGHPALRWAVTVQRAKRLTLAGRLDEAGQVTSEAFQLGQAAGQADAPLVFATQHFWLSWLRGRLDEVRSLALGAVGEFPELPGLLVATARILEGSGRPEEARAELEKLVASDLEWLPRDANALTIASVAIVSATRLRLPEIVERVAPVLAPYRDHIVADRTNVIGSAVHFLGMAAFALGDLELAEEELNAAIDVHRRLAAPALLAFSQAELARVLADRGWPGDATRARRLIDEARATATELGMAGLLADLAELEV
jgi:tetratricopeptide (TPR) repeat protein